MYPSPSVTCRRVFRPDVIYLAQEMRRVNSDWSSDERGRWRTDAVVVPSCQVVSFEVLLGLSLQPHVCLPLCCAFVRLL